MIKTIMGMICLGTLGSVCLSFCVLLWANVFKSLTKQLEDEKDD